MAPDWLPEYLGRPKCPVSVVRRSTLLLPDSLAQQQTCTRFQSLWPRATPNMATVSAVAPTRPGRAARRCACSKPSTFSRYSRTTGLDFRRLRLCSAGAFAKPWLALEVRRRAAQGWLGWLATWRAPARTLPVPAADWAITDTRCGSSWRGRRGAAWRRPGRTAVPRCQGCGLCLLAEQAATCGSHQPLRPLPSLLLLFTLTSKSVFPDSVSLVGPILEGAVVF